MQRTKRKRLQKLSLNGEKSAERAYIPSAELFIEQDMIADGAGGHLPGLTEWRVETEYIPSLILSDETFVMTCGELRGRCFLISSSSEAMVFQGTGPLQGTD